MSAPVFDLEALRALVREEVEAAVRAYRAPDHLSSHDFEDANERRTFHVECRELAAVGDRRVWKIGRTWYAERAVFQPAAPTSPANDSPTAVFSVDEVVSKTRRATR